MEILSTLQQSTYRAGLLQSQAYRALNSFLTAQLAGFSLSVPEWSCLGIIHEASDSIRPSDIAQQLGIKQPVCTVLLKRLLAKALIERELDESDNRVSKISITPAGKQLAGEVEQQIRSQLRDFLADIDRGDLATYVGVLAKIAAKGSSSTSLATSVV